MINRNKERSFWKGAKIDTITIKKKINKNKNKSREARASIRNIIGNWEETNKKDSFNLMKKAFAKKEMSIIKKETLTARKKSTTSKTAREDLREVLNGSLTISEEAKKKRIITAFTKKEMYNRSAEDISDSTITMPLRRYDQNDQENTEDIIDTGNLAQIDARTKEIQAILITLEDYNEIDNESPETETESQINSEEISGSDGEIIDYTDASINREDLPRIEFDYKNKAHAEKVIEAAKSLLFLIKT